MAVLIRALLFYSTGFTVSSVVVLAMLLAERNSNSWSGNDPINAVPLIPCFHLLGAALFLAGLGIVRHGARQRPEAPRARATISSGAIGGLSLFVLPSATAPWFSGWEPMALASLAAASVAMLWVHPRAASGDRR